MKSKLMNIKHLKICLIMAILVVIVFALTLINSFSEPVDSSAWDGVVAREFTSGNGTEENPYVISNAGELAHFKEVLEGDEANLYLDKIYKVVSSINYGDYVFSINNTAPFTGTFNGNGNSIYNISFVNNIFNEIEDATIKNINISDFEYTLANETGAILANNITDSEIDMVILTGNVSVDSESAFGGLVYASENSTYNNIVLNYDITTESENIYKFANTLDSDEGNNILIKNDDYDNTSSETDIVFAGFDNVNNNINLENYTNDDYLITVSDDVFKIEEVSLINENDNTESNENDNQDNDDNNDSNIVQGTIRGTKGISGATAITEHDSGVSGNTLYINDFTADKNYFKGLNFTEIRNTSIPSGISTGYYDDGNLVKVEIIYDGADINNSALVGAVSPINENVNKYVYFKYYPLERNDNGTLATNSSGDNYIRIELIDNPFSKRPYVNSTEYGFNGWVCNQNVDTTATLCDNATFSINTDDYTRYLDVAVDGGSTIIIHLNASWYEADVVTSYYDISDFNSMSMQSTIYTTTENVVHPASYFWRRNYTQMEFTRTYVRGDDVNGYIPANSWYRTNRNSGTYNYVSGNNTRCARNTTCYGFTANTTAILADSKYEGGTVTFVANFRPTNSNTDTTINTYNTTYMELRDDPDGIYSYTEQVTHTYTYIPTNGDASGFYYQVSNPMTAMIQTGEYYNASGTKCTSASSCTTAYKLIQHNDTVNKSNGNSISLIERANGNDVDANKYYYLVTRDMNIFRYTSTTRLGVSNIQVNRPFTVTGTAVNSTSVTGILSLSGTTFTASNDIVIENIKIYGPNTAGTNNIVPGNDSKTSSVIYANSKNVKIGRNVTSSRNSSYLIAESILGGTNSSVSGTFKVIVESGFYYAYHSGLMGGTASNTMNEITVLGNDYDRVVTANNGKTKFLIGLDGYSGNGHHTAGNTSLFASYTIVKSGIYGFNNDGTANNDATAGMYIGGWSGLCVNSLTGTKVEGGKISVIVGGYGYNGTATTNSTYIGMSGGEVRSIYGGAGHSTTKGNRIINVTGGTVNYSVLGGSDSYNSGSTDDGIVDGSTLIYVGGTAKVGGGTGTLQGVESGSVFGAGGGDTSSTQKGTVNNSHVIINGGTINTSVYGGGNYGSTGTQSSAAATTTIDVFAGTIGNIYGGSKSAGFSKTNYASTSKIDINISGGSITNIYGGSNTTGDINGSVDIDITGGTVSGNIYGGGQGNQTKVTNNVEVTIGDTNNGPTVSGSVYGGSAYGTVNSANQGSVSVVVNKGTITGSVYGGGEGSATYSASVLGNITVDVNGGTVANVYGGGDTAGTASKNVNVNVTGGTVTTNVYGGGKGASTYVNGDVDVVIGATNAASGPSIGGSVYGGSAYGTVNTANNGDVTVTVNKGTITGSVYGGGEGSATNAASVLGNITVDVNGGTVANVYGGGDTAGTASKNVNVNVTGGTVTTNVYGGGKGASTYVNGDVDVVIGATNAASGPSIGGSVYGGSAFGTVNTANNGDVTVTVNKGVITGSVFGGGQGDANNTPYVLGDITVTINGGNITNVYGGNDQAGTHSKLNEVYLNGGTIGSVYGGGNRSSVTTTHVYERGATVTNIYGGSNSLGDVTTANVEIASGSVGTVYGGNNVGGTCATTNVTVNGTAAISNSVYGGGNQVNTTTTNVTITAANGTIPNVYGGGNSASVTTANVTKNGATVGNLFGGSNSTGTVATSIINHSSGTATNIYGGNNAGGNTVNSTINFSGGTATNIFGGGNQATSGTSAINITGGTATTVYGGGNQAGLTTSNVHVTSGNVTTVYGGSNTSGLVTTANVLIDNASSPITAIYGGGNYAQVGTTNVVFNNGTVSNIYGGGNLAQVNGNTLVDINGGTINQNIYGGGNYGVVQGNSNVTITNATILGSAYAGGNGATATLQGNTTITVDGATVIGTNASVPPASGSVFGGGNQAYTGTQANNDSTSTVNIVSGTIYGNVYGGANTSVIYGNTIVNIGRDTVTNGSSYVQGNVYIKGHVFGGGEANASGSEIYDWFFISVTQGVHINVDANGYNSFAIDGSFYGGGNASSAEGDSYLLIKNYGVVNNPKRNVSIQRVTYTTLDNSNVLLKGAIDRANEYDTELFSISRVVNLKLKNNSSLFLETGANLLEEFESLDSSGNIAVVNINEETNTLTRTVDNRIYMFEGKNLNIAKDQQVTDYGEVYGMTFLGIFNYDNNNNVNTGIYNPTYDPGDTLPWSGAFSRGSYVLGKHLTNHNIKVNGFYSNFINEETTINEVNYITPTPTDALFYMWFIGENVLEYNVNLVASKYSTLGSVETSFLEFSKPNTSFQILSFDYSEIASGISLIDRNNIPRIANSASDANNIFGLAMEASNTGWLTTGKTSFYTADPAMGGTTYYEGENSNIVPTMLFYLYHSKNLTEQKDLGTVRISVMAITKLNALSNEIKRLVINVNMSTALFQTTEYEGAMTPGDKYELFTSTSNNITTKSKFSAYYSLYDGDTNIYRTGYHRALASSFVFPENTKITMLNFINGVPEYYYHIITSSDVTTAQAQYQNKGECSYPFSLFTRMGSRSNNSNYDDAAMNAIYYNGTASSEEFIFIVDFSETTINSNQLGNTLLIEMLDSQNESIMTVLGIQHSQLTYNLYSNCDSQIDLTATESLDPLYIGYSDIFDVNVGYQNSSVGGVIVTDTQYFDSKLGLQIHILNNDDEMVSGTDLTGTHFSMDGVAYYPDINGVTHIKLSDKVGNAEKWITFNTDNSSLATGDYTFVFEAFGSPDGIYYSSGDTDTYENEITIINSTYGLDPQIDQNSVVFSGANNDKNLTFTVAYTSLLSSPSIRIAMYRREYDEIYDTGYELVDLQDYVDQPLFATANTNEYLIINNPSATNTNTLHMKEELMTGTYRLSFRLYDSDTMIGEIIRYIIIK